MSSNPTHVKTTKVLVSLANLAVGGISWALMWMTGAENLLIVKNEFGYIQFTFNCFNSSFFNNKSFNINYIFCFNCAYLDYKRYILHYNNFTEFNKKLVKEV